MQFNVLGKSTPTLQAGTLIDYTLKIRGVSVRWQSRIEEWQQNEGFVDTQVKGPYALWHHTHRFERLQGGTFMTDIVRYKLPLGKPGSLLGSPFVSRDISKIFDFRKKAIGEVFP